MKCPYKNFEECIVQECPSCEYDVKEETVYHGRYPYWMDLDTAINEGFVSKGIHKKYIFKNCKLIENNVQPIPKSETHIHNKTETNVAISHSIF